MPTFHRLLFLCVLSTTSAFQLPPLRAATAARARSAPIRLEGETPLTDEQITSAAEKASEPQTLWPEAQPASAVQANELADDVKDGSAQFDPKIIGYVALPALVLLGQLFFTFSRDALGDAALGPAVMDLYIPY